VCEPENYDSPEAIMIATSDPIIRAAAKKTTATPLQQRTIPTNPLTEKELTDRLGSPASTFTPSRTDQGAGIIVCILLVGGGLAAGVAMLVQGLPVIVLAALLRAFSG
jgi:hypothetical protein